MTFSQLFLRRIPPFLRPLRPPNALVPAWRPRFFNSRAPLRLVGRSAPRPQAPYLSTSLVQTRSPFNVRPLSTEKKKNIRYQLRLAAYWTVLGWTIWGGISLGYLILREDWLDRLYPAPEEWNVVVKYFWRQAKREEMTEGHGRGVIDWSLVGSYMKTAMGLLEDFWLFEWHFPSGILEQSDWDRSIPGIDPEDIVKPLQRYLPRTKETISESKIGFDISMKSEAWIRGYFEASMLVAKAAEMQDGMVRDFTRSICFSADHVVGPSNPWPKPVLPGSPPPPLEENCEPASHPPDFFYTLILTTRGYTHAQRMQAALAYAQWADYTSRPALAASLIHWSLDLALSHTPSPATVIDPRTAVIHASAPDVTPNILAAATALASHHARHDAVPAALAIYTSVLRARRAAPEAPPNLQYKPIPPDYSMKTFDSFLRWLTSLPFPAEYPPAPASGDEAFLRSKAAECEEAALMAYVGEILFARGGRRGQGLAWTREATAVAEGRVGDGRLDEAGRKVCTTCVGTGLANWKAMVGELAREADKKGKVDLESVGGWRKWIPFVGSKEIEAEPNWRLEEETVDARLRSFRQAQLDARLRAAISGTSSWFVA